MCGAAAPNLGGSCGYEEKPWSSSNSDSGWPSRSQPTEGSRSPYLLAGNLPRVALRVFRLAKGPLCFNFPPCRQRTQTLALGGVPSADDRN